MTKNNRNYLNTLLILIAFFAFNNSINATKSKTILENTEEVLTCDVSLLGGRNNYIKDTSVAQIISSKDRIEKEKKYIDYTVKGLKKGETTLVCGGVSENINIYVDENPNKVVINDDNKITKPANMNYCQSFNEFIFANNDETINCWIPATESILLSDKSKYSCNGSSSAVTTTSSDGVCYIKPAGIQNPIASIKFYMNGYSLYDEKVVNFPSSSNTGDNNGNTGGASGQANNKNARSGGSASDGENHSSIDSGNPSNSIDYNKSQAINAAQNATINENGVCTSFNVCNTGNEHTGTGHKTFKYSVSQICKDNSNKTKYIAMCLDPGRSSAPRCNDGGGYYSVSTNITEGSSLANILTNLYKKFVSEGSCSNGNDLNCIVKYQTAVRIIEFQNPSAFNGTKGYNNGLKNVYNDYANGKVDYNGAKALANSVMNAGGATNQSTSATIQQVGACSNGVCQFKLTVTNVSAAQVSYTPSVNVISKGQEGSNYVETVELDTNNGDCELVADINYSNPNDIKNMFIIDNNNAGYQRFLIFATGEGNNLNIKAKTALNPGDDACNPGGGGGNTPTTPEMCKSKATIGCAPANGSNKNYNEVTINEGVPDGASQTDWEKCIIHNVDAANPSNSYDIITQEINVDNTKPIKAKLITPSGSVENIYDNSFCTVSCKEKYNFRLPANQANVKLGTYFSLDIADNSVPYHAIAGVIAERKCVSSAEKTTNNPNGDIAVDEYQRRVINLRKQQIDLMNMKSYYEAMLQSINNNAQSDYISGGRGNAWVDDLEDQSNHMHDNSNVETNVRNQYENWKESLGWPTLLLVNDDSYDDRKSLSYGFTFNHYELTSPDSVNSDIKSFPVNGRTDIGFSNISIPKYFASNSNAYCGAYHICNLDSIAAIIENTGVVDETRDFSYNYSYDNSYEDILGGYVTGEGTSEGYARGHVVFQTENTRDNNVRIIVNNIQNVINTVSASINAISNQIGEQSSGIRTCTIEMLENIPEYTYDPSITWDYDQPNYMSMMNSKKLVVAGDEPTLNNVPYYCTTSQINAENTFSCTDIPSTIEFNYLDPSGNKQPVTYYNVKRMGLKSTFDCDNGNTEPDKRYCYYRSSTAFYTYPPDGIATAKEKDNPNTTLIEEDGYVFPVTITSNKGQHYFSLTFEDIGQYFKNKNLGRIMGESGVMNGIAKNVAVCTYLIEEIPDEPDKDKSCQDEYEQSCKDLSSIEKTRECVNKLLSDNHKNDKGEYVCCNYAKQALNTKGKGVQSDKATNDKYESACLSPISCIGFKIYSSWDDYRKGLSSYDKALVDSRGNLQFTVRTVSLNNLFPNNNIGKNWSRDYLTTAKNGDVSSRGLRIETIIDQIQNNGDSIYGQKPDYSVRLTPACIRKIREYNREKEPEGGLLDYDLDYIDDATNYIASKATNSKFLSLLKEWDGCSYTPPEKEKVGVPIQ